MMRFVASWLQGNSTTQRSSILHVCNSLLRRNAS
jgi:hypothetical protein